MKEPRPSLKGFADRIEIIKRKIAISILDTSTKLPVLYRGGKPKNGKSEAHLKKGRTL